MLISKKHAWLFFVPIGLLAIVILSVYFWATFHSIDTFYSPGFSLDAFKSVKLGVSKVAVEANLGAPLLTKKIENDVIRSWYSRQGEDKRANFYLTYVDYDKEHRVIKKVRKFVYD